MGSNKWRNTYYTERKGSLKFSIKKSNGFILAGEDKEQRTGRERERGRIGVVVSKFWSYVLDGYGVIRYRLCASLKRYRAVQLALS